jgi:hypothetical protein
MKKYYDVELIDIHIQDVHTQVGDGPFSSLGLMGLEALVRSYDQSGQLPGKTLLRHRLNVYRVARWPSLAPKKIPRYW